MHITWKKNPKKETKNWRLNNKVALWATNFSNSLNCIVSPTVYTFFFCKKSSHHSIAVISLNTKQTIRENKTRRRCHFSAGDTSRKQSSPLWDQCSITNDTPLLPILLPTWIYIAKPVSGKFASIYDLSSFQLPSCNFGIELF